MQMLSVKLVRETAGKLGAFKVSGAPDWSGNRYCIWCLLFANVICQTNLTVSRPSARRNDQTDERYLNAWTRVPCIDCTR